jgi:hypothetical protein
MLSNPPQLQGAQLRHSHTFCLLFGQSIPVELCKGHKVPALAAGVIYAARADGVLEVWDLLDRSHEPSMTVAPCTTPITYLAFSPAGAPPAAGGRSVQQLLAVGQPSCPCFTTLSYDLLLFPCAACCTIVCLATMCCR